METSKKRSFKVKPMAGKSDRHKERMKRTTLNLKNVPATRIPTGVTTNFQFKALSVEELTKIFTETLRVAPSR
jgi:hypothetical protein